MPLAPDAGDRILAFAANLPADGRSSLHDDLAAGRRIEPEALHGAVLRRARKLGLEIPACESIYSLLAPWARKLES